MEPKGTYLTIDSGINTGVALFKPNCNIPLYVKCFSPSSTVSGKTQIGFEIRAREVLVPYRDFIKTELPIICNRKGISIPQYAFIEEPEFYNNDKGLQAALTGSLKKLLYMYSVVKYLTMELGFCEDVKPKQWKGQLGKRQIDYRIGIIIPGASFDEHISDAVGMGLWVKGLI